MTAMTMEALSLVDRVVRTADESDAKALCELLNDLADRASARPAVPTADVRPLLKAIHGIAKSGDEKPEWRGDASHMYARLDNIESLASDALKQLDEARPAVPSDENFGFDFIIRDCPKCVYRYNGRKRAAPKVCPNDGEQLFDPTVVTARPAAPQEEK